MKLPVSCYIIARNEADRIGHAIRAVRDWVDEIVVVDAFSTDRTAAVARAEGARVVRNGWSGFGQQKRFAEEQCRNDWLLNVDADEVVTPELAREIKETFDRGPVSAAAYGMRINMVYPGWRNPRLWARDHYCLRLYDRRRVRMRLSPVHDSVERGDHPVGHLRGIVLHHSCRSLTDLKRKCSERAQYYALHATRRPTWLLGIRCVTEFPLCLYKYCVVRRHWTGGWMGLRVATILAYYRWIRILHLFGRQVRAIGRGVKGSRKRHAEGVVVHGIRGG